VEVMASKCTSCGAKRFRTEQVNERLELGDMSFTAMLPAKVCSACGDGTFAGDDLHRFELSVARWLADSGVRSPDTFRFMRKALGMRAVDLGKLLDIAAETISRWENGAMPVETRAFALLGALVADRLEGRESTIERLNALRSPIKPPKRATKIELPKSA
jgi:putative zinc finger/helix-turn-helix YgiT family protein